MMDPNSKRKKQDIFNVATKRFTQSWLAAPTILSAETHIRVSVLGDRCYTGRPADSPASSGRLPLSPPSA